MNLKETLANHGDLPPYAAVEAGIFDKRLHCMWLAFADQTAAYYTKVPERMLHKLREYEEPELATEYINANVRGKYGETAIDYHSMQLALMLGMRPPEPTD